MDPVENPYVPGAGTPPPELAGRGEIVERARVTLARIKRGTPAKSFMLVGLRGVGKTVLLNRVRELAEQQGFKAIMAEAHENKSLAALLIPPLRHALLTLDRGEMASHVVKRGLRVLKAFAGAVRVKVDDVEIGLDIDGERGTADSGDLENDLPELLVAVAEAAQARATVVALIIDELQYLGGAEFSALIMSAHRIAQRQLPLLLVGAGLPQLVGLAGKSKSYAERLFDFPPVGALASADAALAISAPAAREKVAYDAAALERIVALTQGYPYFLQEWGYHVWNTALRSPITSEDVDRATPLVIRKLDESFFRVRFDRLTPREKEYLFAMAELGAGPHRSGDIATLLTAPVERVAPIRNSLIRKGMIYSPAHGDTAFTVPLFDEFLRRVGQARPG